MDVDDAIPPPIRRASREALKLRTALDDMLGHVRIEEEDDYDGESSDDAAPPPISRSRPVSLGTATPPRTPKRPDIPPPTPPLKSPFRAESDSGLMPQPLRLSSRVTPESSPRTPQQYTFKAFEEVSKVSERRSADLATPQTSQKHIFEAAEVPKPLSTPEQKAADLIPKSLQDADDLVWIMQQQQRGRKSKSPSSPQVPDRRTPSFDGSPRATVDKEAHARRAEEIARKRRTIGEAPPIPDSPDSIQQRQQQQHRPIPRPLRIPDEIEPDLFRSPKRGPREPLRIPPSPDSPQGPDKAPGPTQFTQHELNSSRVADSRATEGSRAATRQHSRNFSHPFSNPSGSPGSLTYHTLQKRLPTAPQKGPKPFRANSRLPPSLRRWSSLETIESVTTTPEVAYDEEEAKPEPALQRFSTSTEETTPFYFSAADEEDNTDTPRSFHSVPSTTGEDSSGSSPARPSSVRTSSTTTNSNHQSAGSSLLRRLKARKLHEPLLEPEHLQIERTVSVEQISIHCSNSSGSVGTISSSRPSLVGHPSSDASVSRVSQNSVDVRDWKSSIYDVSNLTEAELKKCKKKGINPALFAEMKAARKGKWASPIGGNTFL